VVTSSLALRKVAGGYQRYSCRLFYEKVRSWGLMKNIFSSFKDAYIYMN
jgi:hypothetical protein